MAATGRAASNRMGANTSTYFFGSLGGLLFGYAQVVAGALLFLTPDFSLSQAVEGLVVSSLLFGAMIGSVGTGPLSDRYGRRKTAVMASAVIFVGTAGLAFLLALLLVPETKGGSLEEIEEDLILGQKAAA